MQSTIFLGRPHLKFGTCLLLAIAFGNVAHADYGVFYSLCSQPTWKPLGYVAGPSSNAQTHVNNLNQQYAGTYKFAVGRMTSTGRVISNPTASATCSTNSGSGSGSNKRTCYGVTFSSNCGYYKLYFDPPKGVRSSRQTRIAYSADEVCDWLRRMTNNGWKYTGGSSSNCR